MDFSVVIAKPSGQSAGAATWTKSTFDTIRRMVG